MKRKLKTGFSEGKQKFKRREDGQGWFNNDVFLLQK